MEEEGEQEEVKDEQQPLEHEEEAFDQPEPEPQQE